MAGGGGGQGAASWFIPKPQPARRGQPVGQDFPCSSWPAAAAARARPPGSFRICSQRAEAIEGQGLPLQLMAGGGQGAASWFLSDLQPARRGDRGPRTSPAAHGRGRPGRGLLVPFGSAASAPRPTGRARLSLELMAGGGRQGAASWFIPKPQPARRGQPVGQDFPCSSSPETAKARPPDSFQSRSRGAGIDRRARRLLQLMASSRRRTRPPDSFWSRSRRAGANR
ncbi:hypothetical protein ABE38_24570 [Brevibacillus agri]|nr:hypothetical protein [Brevibacillus agri]